MRRTPEDIYDELLVLRCQSGEADALVELVRRWQPRLLGHAYRLTGDTHAAPDAAQEAWLAIVAGLGRLDDPARFPAWAYRIVTFKCADWTRRRQRERAVRNGQAHLQPAPDDRADTAERPADTIELLRQAMRQLSGEHHAALSLHYLDGLSVAEIAVALDIPQGTVKSRLHHARQRLKTTMERMKQ